MDLPQKLSPDEIKKFVRLQTSILESGKLSETDKQLVLPSLRSLDNPDIVDTLEWYSDRVKLFHPAEPLFDDHVCMDGKNEIFYGQADRSSAYGLVVDSKRLNAVVVQAEAPQWDWYCIGFFNTKSTPEILGTKFTSYKEFVENWQEDPSEFSGDSELSDYWNLYDDDETAEETEYESGKAQELPSNFESNLHREIHARWELYDSCGLSFASFVSDIGSSLGDKTLAGTASDGPFHHYMAASLPNFIMVLASCGLPDEHITASIVGCLNAINPSETAQLLPSGSFNA